MAGDEPWERVRVLLRRDPGIADHSGELAPDVVDWLRAVIEAVDHASNESGLPAGLERGIVRALSDQSFFVASDANACEPLLGLIARVMAWFDLGEARFELAAGAAECLLHLGDTSGALDCAETLLHTIAVVPDEHRRWVLAARLHDLIGNGRSRIGEFEAAAAEVALSANLYGQLAVAEPRFTDMWAEERFRLGLTFLRAGDQRSAMDPLSDSVDFARAAGNLDMLWFRLYTLLTAVDGIGDRRRSVEIAEDLVELTGRLVPDSEHLSTLVGVLNLLGERRCLNGDLIGAEEASRRAVDVARRLMVSSPDAHGLFVAALGPVGKLLVTRGALDEAVVVKREVIAHLLVLAETSVGYLLELGLEQRALADAIEECVDTEASMGPRDDAIATMRSVVELDASYQRVLGALLMDQGSRLEHIGDTPGGLRSTQEAVHLFEAGMADDPSLILPLSCALVNLSFTLASSGLPHEALVATRRSVGLWRQAVAADPSSRSDFVNALNVMGNHLSDLGDHRAAVTLTREAVDLSREIGVDDPDRDGRLAESLNNLGMRLLAVGEVERARAAIDEAVALDRSGQHAELPGTLSNLSAHLLRRGEVAGALEATTEAVDSARRLVAADPSRRHMFATALHQHAVALAAATDRDGCSAAADEGIAVARHLLVERPGARELLAGLLYVSAKFGSGPEMFSHGAELLMMDGIGPRFRWAFASTFVALDLTPVLLEPGHVARAILDIAAVGRVEALSLTDPLDKAKKFRQFDGLAVDGTRWMLHHHNASLALYLLTVVQAIESSLVRRLADPEAVRLQLVAPDLAAALSAAALGTADPATTETRSVSELLTAIRALEGFEDFLRFAPPPVHDGGRASLVIGAAHVGGFAMLVGPSGVTSVELPEFTWRVAEEQVERWARSAEVADWRSIVDRRPLAAIAGLVDDGASVDVVPVGAAMLLPLGDLLPATVNVAAVRSTLTWSGPDSPRRGPSRWFVAHSDGPEASAPGALSEGRHEAIAVAQAVGAEPLGDELSDLADRVLLGLGTATAAHIVCHGRFGPLRGRSSWHDDPHEQESALLIGHAQIGGSAIEHALSRRVEPLQFVALTACSAGRVTGDGQAIGFPTRLLSLGVRTVLAPLWDVDDYCARVLIEAFYAYWRSASLRASVALEEARAALDRNEDCSGSTTGRAFVLFGDPDITFDET